MSTHVVGFRPADEKWEKMKEVWAACDSAGVPVPDNVLDFFDHEHPGDKPGAEVDVDAAVKDWNSTGCSGFEVDVTKLPPGLKILRFYNSW
jgi:hypothetical protein